MTDDDSNADGSSANGSIDPTLLPLTPSNYKVRGEIPDAGATGVFGYSSGATGTGKGVVGRVDSTANDAVGVYGETTATTGDTYGLLGKTGSRSQSAAGAFAESASGNADAVRANSIGSGHGVNATTDGQGSYAVWARNVGKAGTNFDHGVVGETNTAADGVAGVVGKARDDDNNRTYGVKGTNEAAASTSTNPAGVYGEANPSGGSGPVYGVHGFNDWTGLNSAAVRGEDEGGGFVVGLTYGVYGTTTNQIGSGVKGEALFDSTDAYGVVGASISGRGVYGETNSTSGFGVYASAPGSAGPAVKADGTVSKNANATAYLSSNQSINASDETRINFDATEGDDFGAFVTDPTSSETGTYTVPRDGDYRVDLHVAWDSRIPPNTSFQALVKVGTTIVANDFREIAGDETASAANAYETNSMSKVLLNLSQGEKVKAKVFIGDANALTGDTTGESTYMSVSHVG